jgi:hypothetical protein
MNPRDRVVISTPMNQLWTDEGEIAATRGRRLDRAAIRELLRGGPVRFVVANPGHRLRWIPPSERFEFWKAEVAVHLAEADALHLEGSPGQLAYVATEWVVPDGEAPVVLLEANH